MTSAKRTPKQIAREYAAEKLAATSDLFEHSEITGVQMDPRRFILRLNTLVHAPRHKGASKVPKVLADAILSQGEAKPEAELVLFGHWLLFEDRPGLEKTPGKQPNYHEVAKCVAACLVLLHERRKREQGEKKTIHPTHKSANGKTTRTPRKSRKTDITKHDLADIWSDIFDETRHHNDFDTHLRSMRRLLPAYLAHLKSPQLIHGGKTVTKSPEIQAVLEAITGKHEAKRAEPQPSAPVVSAPATPEPFTISLGYSSSPDKIEYRGSAGRDAPTSTLRYQCVSPSSTYTSGRIRPGRGGQIELAPDVVIRGNYKVEALIDRIAILLSTSGKIDDRILKEQIKTKTSKSVFVRDLTKNKDEKDWGAPLPEPDLRKSTGYHFAILIQDPAPEILSAILNAIRDDPGINGAVTLHMIEVSIDFYPTTDDPEEATLRREEMVALLQRHHWAPHSCFLNPDVSMPRYIDARQIYRDPNQPTERKKKIRYLLPDNSNTWAADSTLDMSEIRNRILTSNTGEDLYLNATLAKGGKHAAHHVTIQHKITDQRNRNNHTVTVLPDHERRARVEVTLSGSDTLKERGLGSVGDLGKRSFRKLTRPFLSFTLGTVEPWQHLLEDAQVQMRSRGVYGLELTLRARALEEREQMRTRGEKLPRNLDREGRGLRAWKEMNDVTGKALDELKRRWSGFSWS